MKASGFKRVLKWTGVALLVLFAGSLVAFVASYPAVAAAACPQCYGFEEIGDRVFVGADMPKERRERLRSDLAIARQAVANALEPTGARPFVFACSTNACDRRIGGWGDEGARAEVQSTPFYSVIRFGPRGLDRTLLTHELAHITMHEIVGAFPVIDGRFPAWLNEGVAVIVSNDERYLNPGRSAAERCLAEPTGLLPASPFEWGPAAGRDHTIYAQAACATLRWLEANGGVPGLLDQLRNTAKTGEAVVE